MTFVGMAIAGIFVFYIVVYFITGGSKLLSAIISIVIFCGFFGIVKTKTSREVKFERKQYEQSKGLLSFAADIYKKNSPTRYYTLNNKGSIIDIYDANANALEKSELTYVLTNLVYFGSESEPCGFQIDVKRRKDGKTESWRFHYPEKNFHESENIRLVACNDFQEIVRIYNMKNENVTSLVSEKAFCMDIVKQQ